MKTELDHLPEAKRRELQRVVEILFAEFQDAIALGTQAHKKQGRILKVILYGSYARGDWVDDPVGGYKSDYDLLVVVNHDRLTDMVEYWAKAEDHLMREMTIDHRLTAPVSLIVHTLSDVNAQLKRGRPFFVDIVRDGIALYEAPGHEFVHPEPLSPEEALKEAQGYFDEWFPSADEFLVHGLDAVSRGWAKKAAFELHQASERLFHCALLVLTLYSPRAHKLNFLRSQAEQLDTRLIAAWPRRSKFEQRCFELLRRAYVEARYSPQYKITTDELTWLGERVTALQALVKQVCEDRLDVLRAEA
ncbi:HEPN domain-containing protein [Phenylobacterium montanum]|uniref:HEPN domain-containing protein n=2 Tax=Phenylobacterium montanum TaxID=2823693 RepID=A0A975G533_9CAUL|nr:HEPN domain-containing protein [Caulobacter sp. S6]QUD90687.1 HEPN domain-containing protein [Caulobacter sp. S6]